MKLSRIASLLAGIGILTGAQVALAFDGTIDFDGEVTNATCTINGGGGGNNFTVLMPAVPASSLSTAGDTAGWTTFQMILTNCDPATGNVLAYFEPVGGTVNIATGRLKNSITGGTGAGNVEVALRDAAGSANIFIGNVNTQLPTSISGGSATLTYLSGYYATGVATAGDVAAQVTYTLTYP